MPVEENTAPGTAGSNPVGSTQQPGSISDLGDILLDKSLDTMQKNDFVAVTKNDVAGLGEEEEDNDPFAKPTPVSDSTPIPVVETHATIEDLQNIMLDSPTSESPFSSEVPVAQEVATENEPQANNDDFDLGDISIAPVENAAVEVQQEIQTPTEENSLANGELDLENIEIPVVEETSVEATPIETVVDDNSSINLGEITAEETPVIQEVATATTDNTSLQVDLADINTEIPVVVENVVEPVVEEVSDNSSIDLGSIETAIPENSVEATPIETVVDDNSSINLGEITAEETPVVEETPVENQNIDTTSLETSNDIVVENSTEISPEPIVSEEITPAVETPQNDISSIPTPDVGNALDSLQNTIQTEATAETVPNTNPEAVALEKVADDITQGIDLDSLMVDTPTVAANAQVANDATATQTPTDGLKAMFSGSNGNQKKVLLGLGVFVLIGVLYFGYALIADSTPTTQPTTQIEQNTGDTMDTLSGDVMTDEVATGSIDETSGDIVIDDVATGNVAVDTGSIDTGPTTPVAKTPAEILSSAKDLGGQVRKALIKATIMKNAQMRLSAFGLQKDVETFIQTLENSNDMTTVSDSETKLNSLSQRLDSILQKLDGSSQ